MAKKTNNFFNDKIIGSSASGKPPAFGAGIPQVRILSTQKEVKLTSKEVSFFFKQKKFCVKSKGQDSKRRERSLKRRKPGAFLRKLRQEVGVSERRRRGGGKQEVSHRNAESCRPRKKGKTHFERSDFFLTKKYREKINDNLQFFTDFYSIYKI